MGRLVSLSPMVASLAPMLSTQRDADGHSAVAEPWRPWYSLKRWKLLRIAVFKRDRFKCQCGCGRVEGNTSLLVADHIVPHRGDPGLFWDEANVQTLTKACHDSIKQAAERRAPR